MWLISKNYLLNIAQGTFEQPSCLGFTTNSPYFTMKRGIVTTLNSRFVEIRIRFMYK
jgi:hypothetical protein